MSLTAEDFRKIRGSFESVIETLGTEVRWRQTKPPKQSMNARMGMRTVGRGDQELINAYGLDTRIFTAKAVDFVSDVPVEFDSFMVTATGNTYTVNSVHEIYINDVLVGFKITARADR